MRKLVFGLIIALLFSSIVVLAFDFHVTEVEAPNGFPVHNLDTGLNYTSIQEAIDANETSRGHTIFVEGRIYYENVVVNKAIRLFGENRSTTILDGSHIDNTVSVTADNVSISGFTIQNSGSEWKHDFGVDLTARRSCSVENCIIHNHKYSVYVSYAANNTIRNNIIANTSSYAIMINYFSNDNIVANNTLVHNSHGVEVEEDCEANVIANNNITLTSYHAIYLLRSNMNDIHNNLLSFNGYSNPPLIYPAIKLMYSNNNTLANNLIFNNTGGIGVYFDWGSEPARHNIIKNNRIENNSYGVTISYGGNQSHPSTSTYNHLCENAFQRNDYGIYLIGSDNNTFSHNSVLGSVYNDVSLVNSTCTWDSSFEGNYWSNYTGVDSNHDGIGDTPHVLDANNTDNSPLMGLFSSFNTSQGHTVDVISNSTIDDLEYFASNSTIRMHVSNMTENQTHGFVRICIPHALMTEPYSITVDGANPTYWNHTLYDNGTHRWIYFAYEHSTLEIVIVPEWPSLVILPLFMIATLLGAIIYKRRYAV